MNPKQLLQYFDRISEASDAIPRLRRFILDLAVRGKLVKPTAAACWKPCYTKPWLQYRKKPHDK